MIKVNNCEYKVMDFRVRPPYGTFISAKETAQLYAEPQAFHRACGMQTSPAIQEKSMELFIEEMYEAGIDKAVVPTRYNVCTDNQELIDLVNSYPEQIIGVVGINPCAGEKAITEIKRCVLDGPCKGISLEPTLDFAGFNGPAWHLNEKAVYPIYELCQKQNIPLLLTYGGETFMSQSVAESLKDLALDFPELKIALGHGAWPRIYESFLYARIFPNVFLSPDCYMVAQRHPGWQEYILGANYLLQDKVFFGTAYPGIPFKESLERFVYTSGIHQEVLDKVLYQNGAKFFNL